MPTPTQVNQQGFQSAIYVYQFPVRIWHLTNAFAIAVLLLTGYFIGSPPPTLSGEASDHYLMGYIRFAHFTAAYILIIGLIHRTYWAFIGNGFAREIFFLPVTDKRWREDVFHEVKRYLFLEDVARKYVGHNPVATIVIHFLFLWVITFMAITGPVAVRRGSGNGLVAIHLVFELGDPAVRQQPKPPHLPPPRRVADPDLRHHPCVRSGAR